MKKPIRIVSAAILIMLFTEVYQSISAGRRPMENNTAEDKTVVRNSTYTVVRTAPLKTLKSHSSSWVQSNAFPAE